MIVESCLHLNKEQYENFTFFILRVFSTQVKLFPQNLFCDLANRNERISTDFLKSVITCLCNYALVLMPDVQRDADI